MNLNKLSNRTKGIIFIILSAFGFAMMSAFVKLAGDIPSFQKTFFRNFSDFHGDFPFRRLSKIGVAIFRH